ncbi:MAG: hypothetical protein MI924_01915 [Chloroflexales bacterium]|nr:hypothetical protein [Chloroflexales bacterium]
MDGSATSPLPTDVPHFWFWRTYLLVVSVVFALQGVSWMLFGSFDPFGFYNSLMARAFWGAATLTPEAQKTFSFAVVPLGATTTSYFLLVHVLVKYAFPRRERWAYWAVAAALLLWFSLDTGFSVLHGAWFNVVVVNIPCLAVMGIPLIGMHRAFVSLAIAR